MTKAYFLDATDMAPPEPLVRTLELADNLQLGDYLQFRHRREPYLLYDNLKQRHFLFISCTDSDAAYVVYIWRKGDAETESEVQRQIQLNQLAIHLSNINTDS